MTRERQSAADPIRKTTEASERPRTSQSIDWYAEGQSRTVEVDGVQITVRFIGRKGRRGRIAIEAPAGAAFMSDFSANRSM